MRGEGEGHIGPLARASLQMGWGLSGEQRGLAASSPAAEVTEALCAQFPHL